MMTSITSRARTSAGEDKEDEWCSRGMTPQRGRNTYTSTYHFFNLSCRPSLYKSTRVVSAGKRTNSRMRTLTILGSAHNFEKQEKTNPRFKATYKSNNHEAPLSSPLCLPALCAPDTAWRLQHVWPSSDHCNEGSCYSPQQVAQLRQQQQEFVNRAFENLASELNDARSTTNRAPRRQVNTMSEETIPQQKEWLNRAFGLATEVASGLG